MTYLLYTKVLCLLWQSGAASCNFPKNRLKIRRPQGRGGSSPPLGTNVNIDDAQMDDLPFWEVIWPGRRFDHHIVPGLYLDSGSCAGCDGIE